jgi:catechol 2,3-dioxygenase-like lactoylglutathione lyase family enzyme
MERIKVTELDHIVLNVSDIERSLKFYTEVLGLQAERLDEFKAGKVGFPSVRINGDTIIDLFPARGAANKSLITWAAMKSQSARGRSRAGARVAGRPRCTFSIPTGTRSRSAAIDTGFLYALTIYTFLAPSSLTFTIRLPSISTMVSR